MAASDLTRLVHQSVTRAVKLNTAVHPLVTISVVPVTNLSCITTCIVARAKRRVCLLDVLAIYVLVAHAVLINVASCVCVAQRRIRLLDQLSVDVLVAKTILHHVAVSAVIAKRSVCLLNQLSVYVLIANTILHNVTSVCRRAFVVLATVH